MPGDTAAPVDRRALKILFDTFWTTGGWRKEKVQSTPPDDFEYAKCAGIMFDPLRLSHADSVTRAVEAVGSVEKRAVADAFIVSLASRRLELRSALGSFAVLQHFPRHDASSEQEACFVCGEYIRSAEEVDLNVLNFERLKWGGVRHDKPLYACMDLQLFQRQSGVLPSAADVAVFKSVLKAIQAAPLSTSSASLEKHLAKAFKSSKSERDIVVGILGLCGILATAEHPGYLFRFVPWTERELPARRFVDMKYPACWWQRSDGINREALAYWFGHVL